MLFGNLLCAVSCLSSALSKALILLHSKIRKYLHSKESSEERLYYFRKILFYERFYFILLYF